MPSDRSTVRCSTSAPGSGRNWRWTFQPRRAAPSARVRCGGVGSAAAFAHAAPQFALSGRFVCVATHPFRAEARSADGSRADVLVVDRSDSWWWAVAPTGTRWLELRFGDHWLELPAASGLRATVEMDATGLLVMYFDQAHLGDPDALVIVERAQRLMSAGRPDAADVVLGADRRRTPLDGVLLGSHDTPLRELARTAVPPEDRGYLLPGNRWAVMLDRPRDGSRL